LLIILTGATGCLDRITREADPIIINREQSSPKTGKTLNITMVGDILLAAAVGKVMDIHGFDYPWSATAGQLRQADLAIGNLETSVGSRGTRQPKTYTFQAKPETLQGLVYAGLDIVTVANNHSLDFGLTGLRETLTNLNNYKIHHVGAGNNWAEATRPVILERQGYKIAVLGFTRVIPNPNWAAKEDRPGLATAYDPKPVLDAIMATRPQADLVVVNIHWGKEGAAFPEEYQQKLAKALVDSGADIVMGHHPHVLQGVEIYRGKLIAYSLGNFVFSNKTGAPMDSVMLKARYGPTGFTELSLEPLTLYMTRPQPAQGQERKRILRKLQTLSAPFGTEINDKGEINISYQLSVMSSE